MATRAFRTWIRQALRRTPASRKSRPRFIELESRVNPADPYLVADINTLPTTEGSDPKTIVEMNGIAYFVATDPVHGAELWKSDGTAAGTVMVKDIRPGSVGSEIGQLTVVNGTLYFTARAEEVFPVGGLWKSDGTAAGTVKVFGGGLSFEKLTAVNDTLFFRNWTATTGLELWKTDGTTAGTVIVKDINAGTGNSNPDHLVSFNGALYFEANDATGRDYLWKSDGTAAGTVVVKQLGIWMPMKVVNGTLFITTGELWKSDGTADGTVLVKDIRPGTNDSNARFLTNVNGTLFFMANDGTNGEELWKSDGTDAGTVMVKDIRPGSVSLYARDLTNVNGTLFFRADDGTVGDELWKSDGTAAGTVLVKDIRPGISGSSMRSLTPMNGILYFGASDANGQELWRSDGTTAGTFMVKDLRPDPAPGVPFNSPFAVVGGVLMFTGDDAAHGPELWKTDGTEAGTILVKDIVFGTARTYFQYLADVNGTLFFVADDVVHGRELWKSNGTAAGTVLVKDIRPGFNGAGIAGLTNVNGTLFFRANDGVNGNELWKSDGTEAGTVMVKDIVPGATYSMINSLTAFNGLLYFAAADAANGRELWKSDGTDAGTVLVKDIRPGTSGSGPFSLAVMNGTLYFSADDGATGAELWKSDGTAAGTVMVKDIAPGTTTSYLTKLTPVGGMLFFEARDAATGKELWKSDGTAAGTVMVKDIVSGSGSSTPESLTAAGNLVYFLATLGADGQQLWKSDGTAGGTVLVKDINPGSSYSFSNSVVNVSGTVYFTARDTNSGYELWKSDGTTGGTVLVKDIKPGAAWSSPAFLTVLDNTLYFSADDGSTGTELWKSDGSPAGTAPVAQIVPDSGASNPILLTKVGGRLFFAATTEPVSRELWAYNPNDFGPTVSFTTSGQSGNEASGALTVTAQLSAVSAQTVTVPFTVSGTATGGTDHTITVSPITIPAGNLTGSATITIINDTLDEADETVVVTMGVPTNADAGGTTVHTATIVDDDTAPTVSFTAASGSGAENVATRTATVSLSAPSGLAVTVPFSVSGTANNPDDYSIAPASLLTFAPGETSKTITLTVVNDTDIEPDETVVLTLGTPTNATLGGTTTYTESITDDDSTVSVSFTSASGSADEGVPTRTITVALSEPAIFPVTVPYSVGGTAANPADYTIAPASPLTFAPGETTQTITLTVVGDTDHEADETVALTLGTPTNATLGGTTTYTETIVNDDAAPTVAFSAASGSAPESVATRTVTVVLSGPSTLPVTVPYSVGGTAANPEDYTISPASPLTFAPGETVKTITLTVVDDTLVESDETVVLTLGTPTNATVGPLGVYTETIAEEIGIVVSPLSATYTTEGGGTVNFTVVLTAIPTADVVIPVASSDTTEATTSVTQLVFTAANAGVPQTVTVTGLNDAIVDFNQAYSVVLGPAQSTDSQFAGLDPADFGLVNVEFFRTRKFVDTDGDKFTVKLTGPGQVGVIQTPAINGPGSIDRIILSDTNSLTSRLAVTVVKVPGGDGLVDIGAVSGPALRAFTALKSDLVGAGAFFNGYLGRLQVRDIENGADIIAGGSPIPRTAIIAADVSNGTTINLGSGISTLRVARFGEGQITAPRIGTLAVTGKPLRTIPGDFEADIRLNSLGVAALAKTLGTMTVAGTIRGSAIEAAGHVGLVRAKSVVESSLLLGLDGVMRPGFKLGTFAATGFLGSSAPAFVDSQVTADRIGTVTLKSVATNQPDGTFGVTAGTSLVAVRVTSPPFVYNLSAPSPQGLNLDQDADLEFVVRVG